MDQPLLPRRLQLGTLFRRPKPPADPSPEELARVLKEHRVHKAAAKTLDSLERAEMQHRENRRAKTCLMLGTAGLVLGLTPSIPAVHGACIGSDPGWECALRATALAGGFLALSGSLISGWAIWHQRSHMEEQAQRCSEAISRAMHSKNGTVPFDDVFHRVRSFTNDQRAAFRTSLHDFAKEHRSALSNAAENLMVV